MSESGKRLFEKYEEIYSQRTKSLTQLSKEGNTINRANKETNFETLSGLRGYRIGPVVAMPTAQQAKEGYSQYLQEHGGTGASPSSWLYKENMKQFDTELAKQLGFNSASEAEAWRKSNGLTVHEGPDGMFMVPSDVHSSARHDGYRSMMSKYMKGELSEEDMNSYIRQEKIAYVKHEARERGTRMAKGMGLAMIKDILKHTIIIVCKESYSEFKKQSSESFINRIKAILQRCWNSIKSKVKHIAANIWSNIKGSILSEFLTALNDYLFGTFKNVFKLVRQMWGSIKNAFKIICNKSYSWEERIFEATKILSAGLVGILGFSLNELIEKGLMSIGVPFASFIAECLSGLFAGIMSAIVLMLFDNLKKTYKAQSPYLQMSLVNSKIVCIDSARLTLSTLRTDMMMRDTYEFVGNAFGYMAEKRDDIVRQQGEAKRLNGSIDNEIDEQKERNKKIKDITNKYLIDYDF
jgi:predicted oxidoreductase (fatty acid repression mutant protein)